MAYAIKKAPLGGAIFVWCLHGAYMPVGGLDGARPQFVCVHRFLAVLSWRVPRPARSTLWEINQAAAMARCMPSKPKILFRAQCLAYSSKESP